MAQATCRVTPALDTVLDEAADEVGLFRSDVIRRALVHYIETNPDELEVFDERGVPGGIRTVKPNESERKERDSSLSQPPYDPSTQP